MKYYSHIQNNVLNCSKLNSFGIFDLKIVNFMVKKLDTVAKQIIIIKKWFKRQFFPHIRQFWACFTIYSVGYEGFKNVEEIFACSKYFI